MIVLYIAVLVCFVQNLAAGDGALHRDGKVARQASLQDTVDRQAAEIQTLQASLTTLQTDFATLQSEFNAFKNVMMVDHHGMMHQLANLTTPVVFTGEAGASHDYADGAIVHFDRVLVDVGGLYDSSSGVVTVPEEGIYVIYFRTDPPRGNNEHQTFDLKVNGAHETYAYGDNGHHGSGMVSLRLGAGDQVMVTKRDGADAVGQAAILTVVRVSV